MARVSIQIRGVETVAKRLQGMENPAKIIDPEVRKWAKGFVLRKLYGEQNYGPKPGRGVWAANTTPAQKRAFFAKLNRGEWTGRTGNLGRAWIVERAADANYRIRNTQPYANWMVGNNLGKQQVKWTRGAWWRFYDRFMDEVPELQRRIENGLIRYWQHGRWGI